MRDTRILANSERCSGNFSVSFESCNDNRQPSGILVCAAGPESVSIVQTSVPELIFFSVVVMKR